eukprot:1511342-Alexandrium_andersonii.AAC.1
MHWPGTAASTLWPPASPRRTRRLPGSLALALRRPRRILGRTVQSASSAWGKSKRPVGAASHAHAFHECFCWYRS